MLQNLDMQGVPKKIVLELFAYKILKKKPVYNVALALKYLCMKKKIKDNFFNNKFSE